MDTAKKVEAFSDDARTSAQTGYDTENQLSNNLISVTLAFVALLATAISTGNVLGSIQAWEKWLIMSAMITFCISIVAGLVNYFANMRFHQKVSARNVRFAERAEDANSAAEMKTIDKAAESVLPGAKTARGNLFLLSQILLLIIGLGLTMAFVGALLFVTSETL